MVVNNIQLLTELGFTEYEARAYVSLLQKHPAGAYELSKNSGIPSSKIYEVISRLVERGALFEISDGAKPKFMPMDPDKLVLKYRDSMENRLDELSEGLSQIRQEENISYLRNISDYDTLIEECKHIITGSSRSLLVSGWQEDLEILVNQISRKPKKVRKAIVWFGDSVPDIDIVYSHPVKDTLLAEKGGRQLVICGDDNEAVIATLNEKRVQGTVSRSSVFAALARDYISHDVYILKVVNRFPELLEETYGPGYSLLRDIFKDEVLK